MHKKLNILEDAASKIGLKFNKEKTRTMSINEEKNKPLKLREETIEEVDEFTYLGSITTKKNNTTKDVEKRMNKARIQD
jgi:hypothetical protein